MFHTPAHKNLTAPGACVTYPAAPARDFSFADHGNIVIVNALTPAAKAWATERLPESARSGFGYVVEHRYFADVVDGIDEAGLVIEREGR
jgi:hypothetical protein